MFKSSDKLTRLYSMSVYCLEYIQAAAESPYGVPSIEEGNPETKMVPFARRDFQANFVFQDDNDPINRAWRVMDFLEDEYVQHIYWSAILPDFSSFFILIGMIYQL